MQDHLISGGSKILSLVLPQLEGSTPVNTPRQVSQSFNLISPLFSFASGVMLLAVVIAFCLLVTGVFRWGFYRDDVQIVESAKSLLILGCSIIAITACLYALLTILRSFFGLI